MQLHLFYTSLQKQQFDFLIIYIKEEKCTIKNLHFSQQRINFNLNSLIVF